MRCWPFGRRERHVAPLPDDLLFVEHLLRRNVEDLVDVRDRQIVGGTVVFRGELLSAPGRALDVLTDRLRPFGFTPFLRRDTSGVAVHALPLVERRAPERIGLNILLFALTCLSVLMAGAGAWLLDPVTAIVLFAAEPARLLAGAPFAVTLLAILGTHEFGHYFAARYYKASVSLPYFIPAPPPFPFGTLGAIIRMRSLARDRNALFDIAAAGPLAGLAVAVPAIVLGLEWSRVVPIPPGEPLIFFGDSLLMRLLVLLRVGPIPDGHDVIVHPVALAGWVGLLVTALNLFPVGQLDGGRIAYALFGRRHALVGKLTVGALLALFAVTWSVNWLVWAALIVFLVGFGHHPPLDDVTPLSSGRRTVGWGCLVLLVLLVPPNPISIG
jgi:Zn-dependent protease